MNRKPTLRYCAHDKTWTCRHGKHSATASRPSLAYRMLMVLVDRPVGHQHLALLS